jgi:hypothetical protein
MSAVVQVICARAEGAAIAPMMASTARQHV